MSERGLYATKTLKHQCENYDVTIKIYYDKKNNIETIEILNDRGQSVAELDFEDLEQAFSRLGWRFEKD